MNKEIKFALPGIPVGKERPRVVKGKTGRIFAFTPDKTASYEDMIRFAFKTCVVQPWKPIGDAVILEIIASFPTPLRNRSNIAFSKTTRPDIDNVAKTVMDALNGLAWVDDAQVCRLVATKICSNESGILVKIYWDDDK